MNMMATAMAFFEACEIGKGWSGCAEWCAPNASFCCQAEELKNVDTLAAYADWMTEVCKAIPDAEYEIKGTGADEERNVVLVYGIFSGTKPAGEDGPARPFTTDYVYSIEFCDGRIGHMTKIWNDSYES
mgnify:CR=1 FL=1